MESFEIKLDDDIPHKEAWEQCIAAFLRRTYYRSESTSTLRNYRQILRDFFHATNNAPEAMSRLDVERFMQSPSTSPASRGKPVAASTRNQRLTVIRTFYAYAATFPIDEKEPGKILFSRPNPCLGLPYSRTPRQYRAFSYEELTRFFDVIPTDTVQGRRDRAIYLLYFWTGRRRSEIARLNWGDLSYGLIADSEDQHMGWIYHFRGKGRQEIDDKAELPEEAKIALDAYLVASGRMETIRPEDPLFTGIGPPQGPHYHDRRLSANTINLRLKQYARAAGLDARRLSLHSLRHTAAFQRYLHGEKIHSIKRLLRHASIATTAVYLEDLAGTADPGAKLLSKDFGKFSRPQPD